MAKVPLHEYEKAVKIERATDIGINIFWGVIFLAVICLVIWGLWALVALTLPMPLVFWPLVSVLTLVVIGVPLHMINNHYTTIRMDGDQKGTIDE